MTPRPPASSHPPGRTRARGSVLLTFALSLAVIVALLGATQIGYDYYVKRELQKTADLAALAGARALRSDDACSDAQAAVSLSVSRNPAAGLAPAVQTRDCGRWQADQPGAASVSGSDGTRFTAQGSDLNAVHVVLAATPPVLLPGLAAGTVRAEAVARATRIAGFSLGTGVASLDAGILNLLLSALLGSQVSLDLVSYQGIANASVSLLDLISVPGLSVGSVDELLKLPVDLKNFELAVAQAVGQDNTVAIGALEQLISATAGSLRLTVGDLLKVQTADPEDALLAKVNVLDLILAAAEVANGTNAVSLGSSVNLPPIAQAGLSVVVTEPPAIAIGEAGKDASGQWRTQAHAASVRIKLDASVVDLSQLPVLPLIASVSLLKLPLYIELAPGDAQLTDIECPQADGTGGSIGVRVVPGVANICIGNISDTAMKEQSAPICSASLGWATLSEIKLLSFLNVAKVQASISVPLMTGSEQAQTLHFDLPLAPGTAGEQAGSDLSILPTAVAGLATSLDSSHLRLTVLGIPVSPLTDVLGEVVGALNTYLIEPLVQYVLDPIVMPLLNALGLRLGYAEVTPQPLDQTCNAAGLVF